MRRFAGRPDAKKGLKTAADEGKLIKRIRPTKEVP
jgi:hypothetical protein